MIRLFEKCDRARRQAVSQPTEFRLLVKLHRTDRCRAASSSARWNTGDRRSARAQGRPSARFVAVPFIASTHSRHDLDAFRRQSSTDVLTRPASRHNTTPHRVLLAVHREVVVVADALPTACVRCARRSDEIRPHLQRKVEVSSTHLNAVRLRDDCPFRSPSP